MFWYGNTPVSGTTKFCVRDIVGCRIDIDVPPAYYSMHSSKLLSATNTPTVSQRFLGAALFKDQCSPEPRVLVESGQICLCPRREAFSSYRFGLSMGIFNGVRTSFLLLRPIIIDRRVTRMLG